MAFGERLRHYRKIAGLTVQGLADAIKKSKTTIGYWENETTYPPLDKLLELCKILKVTPNDLLGYTGSSNVAEPSAQYGSSYQEDKLERLQLQNTHLNSQLHKAEREISSLRQLVDLLTEAKVKAEAELILIKGGSDPPEKKDVG